MTTKSPTAGISRVGDRLIAHFPKMQGSVMLDSDVFDMFRTSEEVNNALRILIREGRVPHAPYEHTLTKRDS
jgi:hypothetical protein